MFALFARGKNKSIMENVLPSSLSVNTVFSQLSSHSSPSDREKQKRFFFGEEEEEGVRKGEERWKVPFVDPGQLLPHVHLSARLTHTAAIRLRHRSGDTRGRWNVWNRLRGLFSCRSLPACCCFTGWSGCVATQPSSCILAVVDGEHTQSRMRA